MAKRVNSKLRYSIDHSFDNNKDLVTKKYVDDSVDSNIPNGFENTTDSTISYTLNTRTITVSGTYTFWNNGVQYNKAAVTESVVHGTSVGKYFIYYVNGTLTCSALDVPWDLLTHTPVCMLYYNGTAATTLWTGPEGFILEERHGVTMDDATHVNLHNNIGTTVKGSGFSISGTYETATGTGGLAAVSYGVESGIILDEDLPSIITALTDNAGVGNQYPVFYRIGSGTEWRWYNSNVPVLKNANNNNQYNRYTGGAFQLTEITSNNTYMNYYLCAVPFKLSSSGNSFRFIWVMGQANHLNLTDANNESLLGLNLSGLPFSEIAPLYKITMKYNTLYSVDSGKTRIESITNIVGTKLNISLSFSPQNHNTLSNRSDAGSHPATAISTTSGSDVQTELNAKEPTLTKGNLTESTSSVLTVNGGTGSVIGTGTSIQVKQSSGSQSGYLSSTDWTTFNNKQAALGFTPENSANKNAASGYAGLDADSKLNVNLDASKITTGTIDIARLPSGALERLVSTATQTTRYALTANDVQLGDTVKQLDTGVMYIVVDTSNLGNANGYSEYTAGTATSVPWSGVTSKPTTVSGYGITDAYTKTEINNGYLPLTGGDLNGNLNINNPSATSYLQLNSTSASYSSAIELHSDAGHVQIVKRKSSDTGNFSTAVGVTEITNVGSYDFVIGTYNDAKLILGANNQQKMIIKSNGSGYSNIRIGGTEKTFTNGFDVLQINNTAFLNDPTNCRLLHNAYHNSVYKRISTGYAEYLSLNSGNIYVQYANTDTSDSTITWEQAFQTGISGNGFGVTNMKTWDIAYPAVQVGSLGAFYSSSTEVENSVAGFSSNAYVSGGVWKRKINDECFDQNIQNGNILFRWADAGAADSTISSWTEAFRCGKDGSIFYQNVTLPNDPTSNLHAATKQYVDNAPANNAIIQPTQWVIDGNFQVAQVNPTVGTEITNPASGTYPVFDIWRTYYDAGGGTLPATIKHSQQLITSGSVPGSKYCMRLDVNGAGSGFGAGSNYFLAINSIEHGTQNLCGAGKSVTVSFYARSTIANKKLGLSVSQQYGTGGSPSTTDNLAGTVVTLTSTWTRFTHTFTTNTLSGKTFGTNNDDRIDVGFMAMWGSNIGSVYLGGAAAETFVGSGVIEIAQVQIDPGTSAKEFRPVPFDMELRRCQRYYEKSYPIGVAPLTASASAGASMFHVQNTIDVYAPYGTVFFKVPKRIIPNVTIYPITTPSNTGRVSNFSETDLGANTGDAISKSQSSFVCRNNTGGSISTGYSGIIFHWVSDARF